MIVSRQGNCVIVFRPIRSAPLSALVDNVAGADRFDSTIFLHGAPARRLLGSRTDGADFSSEHEHDFQGHDFRWRDFTDRLGSNARDDQ